MPRCAIASIRSNRKLTRSSQPRLRLLPTHRKGPPGWTPCSIFFGRRRRERRSRRTHRSFGPTRSCGPRPRTLRRRMLRPLRSLHPPTHRTNRIIVPAPGEMSRTKPFRLSNRDAPMKNSIELQLRALRPPRVLMRAIDDTPILIDLWAIHHQDLSSRCWPILVKCSREVVEPALKIDTGTVFTVQGRFDQNQNPRHPNSLQLHLGRKNLRPSPVPQTPLRSRHAQPAEFSRSGT